MNGVIGNETQVLNGGNGMYGGGGMYGAALPLVGNLGVGSMCGGMAGGYGMGGFGGMGILELLIFASLFGGRNGGLFGGGNCGNNCGCDNHCGHGGGHSGGFPNFTAFDSLQNQINTVTATINANKLDTQLNHIDHELCETNHHIDDCCCKMQGAIKDSLYANQTNFGIINASLKDGFCAVINNNDKNTYKIIDATKEGFAQVFAYLNAEKMSHKDEIIAKQNLQISQAAQNDYLINKVACMFGKKEAQPVFIVDKCHI